ncbi:MAG: C-GCAxxG-C-C family protein [Clostridia bacterium]|nr:C-GCAxxG-C-C family protein [Clostridia bacterium]
MSKKPPPAHDLLEHALEKNMRHFQAGRIQCAECVLTTMAEYYGFDTPVIPRIATAFGGGIAGMQNACGAYTGGAMVIGMVMGRDEPGGNREPAVTACKALRAAITERCGSVDCSAIVGKWDFGLQGHVFRADGGKHQTVCEPLVAAVCRYLASAHPRASVQAP